MLRVILLVSLACAALAPAWAQPAEDLRHTVAAGETLIGIAASYGVGLDQVLALNNLDPEAFLQIGQQLLIATAEQQAQAAAATPSAAPATPTAISARGDGTLSAAPILPAAAPMMDPADLSLELCFAFFHDANQNARREPSESFLAAGEIRIYAADGEQLRFAFNGAAPPECRRDLARDIRRIEARPPAGYGLTSPSSLALDVGAGGSLRLEFGALPGAAPFVPPPLALPNPEPAPPENLLSGFSGVFAWLLAFAVLALGAVAAWLARGR